MSQYRNAFAILAERGTPIGATALLERVDTGLNAPLQLTEPPRRRFPAIAVAAAVFAAIFGGGLLWGLLVSPSSEVATGDTIQWMEIEEARGGLEAVASGPGGFVRTPHVLRPGRAEFWFSPDGMSWRPFILPDTDAPAGSQPIATTRDTWLLTLDDGSRRRGWVSPDGLTWQEARWSDELVETIGQVVGSPGGFVALTNNIFGAGPQMLWSTDGIEWDEIGQPPAADLRFGSLWGTAGGAVWVPFVTNPALPADVYHTTDGERWIAGTITLPEELRSAPMRLMITAVEYFADRFVAIGEVAGGVDDPFLYVWTSVDGVEWTPQGIPPFGSAPGRAVITNGTVALDGRIVVAPATVSIGTDESDVLIPSGEVISTGELWSSTDGVSWTRSLSTALRIESFSALVTDAGDLIGVWVGRVNDPAGPLVLVTTAPLVPTEEIDQAGLELQAEILADGVVTREELETAWAGWKACMEDRGLIDVSFEIQANGGVSTEYGSRDRTRGEAEDAACRESYVNRVESGLGG